MIKLDQNTLWSAHFELQKNFAAVLKLVASQFCRVGMSTDTDDKLQVCSLTIILSYICICRMSARLSELQCSRTFPAAVVAAKLGDAVVAAWLEHGQPERSEQWRTQFLHLVSQINLMEVFGQELTITLTWTADVPEELKPNLPLASQLSSIEQDVDRQSPAKRPKIAIASANTVGTGSASSSSSSSSSSQTQTEEVMLSNSYRSALLYRLGKGSWDCTSVRSIRTYGGQVPTICS